MPPLHHQFPDAVKTAKAQKKRLMLVFNTGGPGRIVIATNEPGTLSSWLPPAYKVCALDMEALMREFPPRVVTQLKGNIPVCTRPARSEEENASTFSWTHIRMRLAILASQHKRYQQAREKLREEGLIPVAGDYGFSILKQNREALRVVTRFARHGWKYVNAFARVLAAVEWCSPRMIYIPPAPLPTGFGSLFMPWALSEDMNAPFPIEQLGFDQGPWKELHRDTDRQKNFAELLTVFRAALLGVADNFKGATLPEGGSRAVEQAINDPALIADFRRAHAAFRQLTDSLGSHADRCEILLSFLMAHYIPEIIKDIKSGPDHKGLRDAAVSTALQRGDEAYAPPQKRGAPGEREKYAKLIDAIPGQVFSVLMAPDAELDAALKKLPKELEGVARALRDEPRNAAILSALRDMYRDPEQHAVVVGMQQFIVVTIRDGVLPALFFDPGLSENDLDADLRRALVLAAVLTRAGGADTNRALGAIAEEHPLDLDEKGVVRDAGAHAAAVVSRVIQTLAFDNERVKALVKELPALTSIVSALPQTGARGIVPALSPNVLNKNEITASEATPPDPRLINRQIDVVVNKAVAQLTGAKPGRNGKAQAAPAGTDSELTIAARDEVTKLAPKIADRAALGKKASEELTKRDDLRASQEAANTSYGRTIAAISENHALNADRAPELARTIECVFGNWLIKSEPALAATLGTSVSPQVHLARDLMLLGTSKSEEMIKELTISRYLTDDQIANIGTLRVELENGAKARWPLARLIGDLYALEILVEVARAEDAELVIVFGDAKFCCAFLKENISPKTTGGIFRNGRLVGGQALPVAMMLVGRSMFNAALDETQFVAQLRGQALVGNGQSYLLPPVVLPLGAADDDGLWMEQGERIAAAAGDDLALHVVPSPMLANDPQTVLPASFLVGARYLGGDLSGLVSPADADIHTGGFASLAATKLNAALDRILDGPLRPGVNTARSLHADVYAHTVSTIAAAIEKSGAAPAATYASLHPAFQMNGKLTNKDAYRAAVVLLKDVVPGDNPNRFALDQIDSGALVVRKTIDPSAKIDSNTTTENDVAQYPVPFVAAQRNNAQLTPVPPVSPVTPTR
jgi:hypothetical protein